MKFTTGRDSDGTAFNDDVGPLESSDGPSNWSVVPANIESTHLPKTGLPPPVVEHALAAAISEQQSPTTLGRYQIERRLGEGGMGVVYAARDTSNGNRVAVKLLKPHCALHSAAWQRFLKEARVWQDVRDPCVVQFLGLELDRDRPFIVSEMISGLNLAQWVQLANGLSEATVLKIFISVARGLIAIHASGIIHRDVKPENILVELRNGDNPVDVPDEVLAVKISDFGVARHVEQTESLVMTRTQSLLGTPRYLAPEQFCDNPKLEPTSDLYSLGISMYFSVTGQLPFDDEDLWQLADQHRFIPPRDPQILNRKVSNGLRSVLLKLLEKAPEDRYQSAEELLNALVQLNRGEPIRDTSQLKRHAPDDCENQTIEFRWELKAAASSLWPVISQTNQVNRALGLPSAVFTPLKPGTPVLRKARAKLAGVSLHWTEYPFCWVQPFSMTVLRIFENGPYRSMSSEVELNPLPNGGTLLVHRFRYACRNFAGRMLAHWQLKVATRGALDRIYRRIDARVALASNQQTLPETYSIPVKFANGHRILLDQLLKELSQQGVNEKIVSHLEDWILQASDLEVSRLQVRKLAKLWGVNASALLKAFLLASRAGGLRLYWDVICPRCRVAATREEHLAGIGQHASCDFCQNDFEVDFRNGVELIFDVAPRIRLVSPQTWCVGGPFHAPHVAAQVYLAQNEHSVLQLRLPAGDYQIASPQLATTFPIRIRDRSDQSQLFFSVGQNEIADRQTTLSSSSQRITLLNRSSESLLLRLEQNIRNQDVLTAAEAITFREFRELFPNESVAPQTLLSLDHAYFLAIRLQRLQGDSHADEDRLEVAGLTQIGNLIVPLIREQQGEILDVSSDTIAAMFRELFDAKQAMASIVALAEVSDSNTASTVDFAVNLHCGPVIVSHLLGYPKYFGKTITQLLDFTPHSNAETTSEHCSCRISQAVLEHSSTPFEK